MTVPMTLHIGRPCMQCTPGRIRGPGGTGLSPCHGLGEEGGGGRETRASCRGGGQAGGAMRQRKLGSHTPPCHRRMVITTLFNVMLAALQRRPVLYHTRWLLTVHWLCSSEH